MSESKKVTWKKVIKQLTVVHVAANSCLACWIVRFFQFKYSSLVGSLRTFESRDTILALLTGADDPLTLFTSLEEDSFLTTFLLPFLNRSKNANKKYVLSRFCYKQIICGYCPFSKLAHSVTSRPNTAIIYFMHALHIIHTMTRSALYPPGAPWRYTGSMLHT